MNFKRIFESQIQEHPRILGSLLWKLSRIQIQQKEIIQIACDEREMNTDKYAVIKFRQCLTKTVEKQMHKTQCHAMQRGK